MCGICGFTGYRQDQKDIIEKMMRSIAHRGPDSEGSFCDEKIALGFRRLSIIDLEEGYQPMESADGNLHLVFNGEIYDYKELRTELEKAGISFRTHSDTEVLVNTIQQYGEKALDKLRGMFGFAVWNEKEQTLMLARDFFGIKPVYYAQIDGHFVFASEIKSILAFPGYERKVNQQERNPLLLFKLSHKPHLMLMDIGKGKDCFFALFRIEAYRNPLHCPDIIHRTFLFKIRQGDLSGILGDPNRRDRCRHFLNQCQPLFTVLFIAPVDQFFQCRTPESS